MALPVHARSGVHHVSNLHHRAFPHIWGQLHFQLLWRKFQYRVGRCRQSCYRHFCVLGGEGETSDSLRGGVSVPLHSATLREMDDLRCPGTLFSFCACIHNAGYQGLFVKVGLCGAGGLLPSSFSSMCWHTQCFLVLETGMAQVVRSNVERLSARGREPGCEQ
jgi:hypothetical protein